MKGQALSQQNRIDPLFHIANALGMALLGYLALSAGLGFVLEGLAAGKGETAVTAAALVRYALSLLIPFGLLGWTMRGVLGNRAEKARVPAGFCAAAVAAGFGTACLGNFLSWLMQLAALKNGLEIPQTAPQEPKSISALIVTFVGYTLLAALVEEITFRGVILHLLRPWGDLWAIWCSAALFALCHASAAQLMPALLTGAVLGALTVMTGSIRLSVLVHTFYNGMAILLNWLLRTGENGRLWPVFVIWGAAVLAALALLPVLRKRWHACRMRESRPHEWFYRGPVLAAAAVILAVRVVLSVF